jgi:magnesium transporter
VEIRTLVADGSGRVEASNKRPESVPPGGWVWIDVVAGEDDLPALLELAEPAGLDLLAVRDAVLDVDMPKADDFGDHLLVVLHSLSKGVISTYEIDCFVTRTRLITIHAVPSDPIDALWAQAQARADLGRLRVDELLGVLADLTTRSLLAVLEAFDDRLEELSGKSLSADPALLEDLTAVRTDLKGVRRVVHPLRETLDVLRHSSSDLVSERGRRRFSDVFDVASRLADGLDEARAAIAETLDAYRGAEARQATEVSKVLTVYAAIMLPLGFIAGFFGMNFSNLPWTGSDWGWIVVTLLMVIVAVVSLGMFISLGWVRRPSGRQAGRTIGQGLLEATKTPVHIVGAVFEMSAMPVRATTAKLTQAVAAERPATGAGSDGPPVHGAE